jgi:hypothetical protein
VHKHRLPLALVVRDNLFENIAQMGEALDRIELSRLD